METKFCPTALAVKAEGEDGAGVFEGIANAYGVRDLGDDIVEPGAFKDSLKTHRQRGTFPAMLWHHNLREPVGKWLSLEESQDGLKAQGRLAIQSPAGQERHELVKMGAIDGLSIGFRPVNVEFSEDDNGNEVRHIKKADLIEVSLVTLPMNQDSRVQSAKDGLTGPRLAEHALREAGFSNSEAKRIVANGFKGQRDADDGSGGGDGGLSDLLKTFQQAEGKLSSHG